MPPYTVALEAQINLYSWINSPAGKKFIEARGQVDELVYTVLDRSLRLAETYFWSEDMCALLEYAAPDMPNMFLDFSLLPTESGFIMFEKPLVLPSPGPDGTRRLVERLDELNNQALDVIGEAKPRTDAIIPLVEKAKKGPLSSAELRKLAEFSRKYHKDKEDFARWDELTDFIIKDIELIEQGYVDSLAALSWTTSTYRGFDSIELVFYRRYLNAPNPFPVIGTPQSGWDWRVGEGLALQLEEVPKTQVIDRVQLAACIRYSAAAFNFLSQHIIMRTAERPDRAARRRAPEWKPDPVIQVVRLRRVHHAKPGVESEEQDWAFRWVVGGHWRQQYYPSLNLHKPKWIGPYIKGPDDKPLKPAHVKIFAIVR